MPCLLVIAVLLFPRVILALMWFFSTWIQRAFHGEFLLPLIGFFFLPLTTLVYVWEMHSKIPLEGINLLWLIIAVIVDLGGIGSGARGRSRN